MKNIIVLGATGSIGSSTIDIIRNKRDSFCIVGLSAHTNIKELRNLAKEFGVSALALTGKEDLDIAYSGQKGLLRMIKETQADIVVNGLPGAPGLPASITSLQSGKDLALANKETMVMAGDLINKLARDNNLNILPVDSEHSAIFELLRNHPLSSVEDIILTASGGAFRDRSIESLKEVTLKETLQHPTWSMGPKITIDSATMGNKGLEVIEAVKLFHIPAERIKVVIHPQSIVHSMIKTKDGAIYAQLSVPDMRNPIQNALTWPQYKPGITKSLDFTDLNLSFTVPDTKKYPLLKTAYQAATKEGGYSIAYNASNEMAVDAFVEGKISYLSIASVVEKVLQNDWDMKPESFSDVFSIDKQVRELSETVINGASI